MMEGPSNNIKPPVSKFRFTEAEIKEKVEKLMALGRTEDEAREIVSNEEVVVQAKQNMTQKERVKDVRYLMPDEPAA